jgi:methyl-accepting chemotaxis protein
MNKTADLLNEINTSTAKADSLVGEIASASQEQSASITEMNKALIQINNVVQQNSSVSEETASASEKLNEQVSHLRQLISGFSLKQTQQAKISPRLMKRDQTFI